MSSLIKKFNPYDLPEETLRAIATGRERVLEDILGIIARNAEGSAVQHLQVVAPRGYGKSFLMRMVQSAVSKRVEEGLPVAVALLPEEQHNVDAPHRLLNEIQRVLEGRPADSLLGGAFAESEGAWEQAVAALDASIAARLPEGRGIAIAIVENFDQLISEVFRDKRDQSRLRALMDRRGGRLMLLATATRRADAAYEQRLFHATRMIELAPWQEESCLAFFERLRGHRTKEPMSLQTRVKAKAIAHFIGGSPRMATVLAEVLDSNDALHAAKVLDALVDELTPYYKHRIESLSRRARTLLDALLRMGEPRTQSEIAARLGTMQARIAEPFNELRARGEVVGVKAEHSAEMLYRVGDRLMAHYYRRRHLSSGEGKSLLEGMIEFLEAFYTQEEMQAEAERLRALGHTADAAVFERLAATRALTSSGQLSSRLGDNWLTQLRERVVKRINARQVDQAIALCREAVHQSDTSGDRRNQALSRQFLGWVLGELGRYKEAVDTLRNALSLAEQVGDMLAQANSSTGLGWSLDQLGKHEEAVDTLRRAHALAKKAGNLQEQEQSSRLLGWSLGHMKRYEEAVDILRSAFSLAEQLGDRQGQMRSLFHLGWSLSQLGQHEEAVGTLRNALSLAEQNGDAVDIAWIAAFLVSAASKAGDDATATIAWQRAVEAGASASTKDALKNKLPNIGLWFEDAAVAALRSGQFSVIWSTSSEPTVNKPKWPLSRAQFQLAASIEEASQTRGRSAAYALTAHCVEVLSQDAAVRATRDNPTGPEPILFLRGILSRLANQATDSALLRDIIALLEQRLSSETAVERALLEAAARRAEMPDDPAALERVDPDVATALGHVFGNAPKTASKLPKRRSKRSGTPRRKK
jgi:tetratricopeptide (TPR) repeat protein